MAASVHLAPPPDVWLRLSAIETLTGEPQSTMREAIRAKMLKGRLKGSAYYTTLNHYNAWIESSHEGGGDAGTAPEWTVELLRPDAGTKDPGKARKLENTGSGKPKAKTQGTRKRKRRGIPIVYDMGEVLAERQETQSRPVDG